MKMLSLIMFATAAVPNVSTAEPRHGTTMSYRIGNDTMAAQIWTVSHKVVASRVASEVAKGGFPKSTAQAVGRAFMDDHNMNNCAISKVALEFDTVPGLYAVFYRC